MHAMRQSICPYLCFFDSPTAEFDGCFRSSWVLLCFAECSGATSKVHRKMGRSLRDQRIRGRLGIGRWVRIRRVG